MKVLIVDDEINIQKVLKDIITDNGWTTFVAESTEEAWKVLEKEFIDVMLLDVFLKDEKEGIDFLKKVRAFFDFPPEIIMITGHGSIDMAVEALKNGAYDFIEKPPSIERLVVTVSHAAESLRLKRESLYIRDQDTPIIGRSRHLESIISLIAKVAPTGGNVLITGESGSGKELVAKSIHLNSLRKDGPFVIVNSAAIPEDLVEAELFGYEKGAFTNALKMKRGKFELADSGTLFFDEIGDMSLKTQSKILRAIQEKKVERVGGEETLNVNARIIAATNKNIEEMMKGGKFREDLYYRLNVVKIELKPLRERTEDIVPLFEYYVDRFSKEYGKPVRHIDASILERIVKMPWKGNIRELKNFAERAVIFSGPNGINPGRDDEGPGEERPAETFNEAKDDFEREYIKRALSGNGYNISKTARALGMDRSNLFKKIRSLGINIEDCKDSG